MTVTNLTLSSEKNDFCHSTVKIEANSSSIDFSKSLSFVACFLDSLNDFGVVFFTDDCKHL
jgi:hypothetical protein